MKKTNLVLRADKTDDIVFEYCTKWINKESKEIIWVPDSMYQEMLEFARTYDGYKEIGTP